MTFSIALPRSTETLSFAGSAESENGSKSGASQDIDGFADLLNQLASILPAMAVPSGDAKSAAGDRQTGELPTGKTLPPLPADAGKGGTERFRKMGLLGVPAAVMSGVVASPAIQIDARPGGAEAKAMPEAMLPGKLFASGPVDVDASTEQPAAGFQVRIAAADKPHDAKTRIELLTSLKEIAIRPHGPAAASQDKASADRLGQGAAATAAVPNPIDAKLATAPATGGQAPVQAALAAADGKPGEDKPATKEHASRVSATPSADTARSAQPTVATSFEQPIGTERLVAAAPRVAAADQFANVERVVEHLMAARQMDLSKPTAISVAHKEFGALTVTFDQSAGGMNVEIAADNREAQRALAAAMAGDRGTGRQHDTGGNSLPTANQSAPATADRGSSSGNFGAGTGHGGGHDSRPQHSEQRGRQGERAPSGNPQPAHTTGDGAHYA
ncbi:hypothetical protein [Qipengyuania qiaonensis]|uniref:Flagellar hook-length control protein FliK n=1 Tax=Qipengyuania qiaonensis TaxID=2867240 RepID=A0ABS7J4Q9_9SPHN|nr:hypothetical protein [Qipengyuania qiaonensis]MBX7481878.1 hypothetical protein [Qipengyuania qiaonensis]